MTFPVASTRLASPPMRSFTKPSPVTPHFAGKREKDQETSPLPERRKIFSQFGTKLLHAFFSLYPGGEDILPANKVVKLLENAGKAEARGELDQKENLLKEALSVCNQYPSIQNKMLYPQVLFGLGQFYKQQRNYLQAVIFYQKAFETYEAQNSAEGAFLAKKHLTGMETLIRMNLEHLGLLYKVNEEFSAAKQLYGYVLENYKSLNDTEGVENTQNLLQDLETSLRTRLTMSAFSCLGKNHIDKAKFFYNAAMSLCHTDEQRKQIQENLRFVDEHHQWSVGACSRYFSKRVTINFLNGLTESLIEMDKNLQPKPPA